MNDTSNSSIIDAINKATADLKNQLENTEKRLLQKLNEITDKTNILEKENSILRNRVQYFEERLKKNNIIVFGIKESEYKDNSLQDFTLNKINTLLNLKLDLNDINNIYSIGTKNNKPIVVEFVSFLKKLNVLKNCNKLKDTGIYISRDLTKKQQEEHRILRKHLKYAKNNNLNAFIKNGKLFVNNQIIPAKDLTDFDEDTESPPQELHIFMKSNSAPATPVVDRVTKNNEVDLVSPRVDKGEQRELFYLHEEIKKVKVREDKAENNIVNRSEKEPISEENTEIAKKK